MLIKSQSLKAYKTLIIKLNAPDYTLPALSFSDLKYVAMCVNELTQRELSCSNLEITVQENLEVEGEEMFRVQQVLTGRVVERHTP